MSNPEGTSQPLTPSLTFLDGAEQISFEASFLRRNGDTDWRVNNSSIRNYFADVIFPGLDKAPFDAIVERLGTQGTCIAMDLAGGSQGRAIRDLIEMGIIGKGLFTNYEDRRLPNVRAQTELGHVAGDLTKIETWQEIIEWVNKNAPEGLDLILHRPFGALQYLTAEYYYGALSALLGLLKSGGVMFCQIPYSLMTVRYFEGLKEVGASLNENPEIELATVARSSDFDDCSHALIYKAQ